ncbi:MAG TPA: DUF1802 family protein [Tepidisphaeraceae bacterium]|jgi:hypothetical protein|nr:DUF1802 family protein [Tepidisphaeraceae bacterium]
MALQNDLQVALKEWAAVCQALGRGRQIILLRKGGIYESAGEFEIEHRQFLLFPTYLHQNAAMLKTEQHAELKTVSAEPAKIHISLAAEITDIVPMSKRAAMYALDDEHIWTPPLIDMRFNYRPQNPLYLLLLRAYRLLRPVTIANTPAYAGCKSWVPMEQPIDTADAASVLDDGEFGRRRHSIIHRAAAM